MQVRHSSALATHWRADVLRTNLWLVPAIEVLAALGLFAAADVLERIGAESRMNAAEGAYRRLSVEASHVMDVLRERAAVVLKD